MSTEWLWHAFLQSVSLDKKESGRQKTGRQIAKDIILKLRVL